MGAGETIQNARRNIVWSAGEAAVSCCGNALDPLAAKPNEGCWRYP